MAVSAEKTWRDVANTVLRSLYAHGHQPTAKEIFDAYPFGPRENFPYKVWCEQARWFKAGQPTQQGKRKVEPIPEGQEALL
jgi:hypothetical protein